MEEETRNVRMVRAQESADTEDSDFMCILEKQRTYTCEKLYTHHKVLRRLQDLISF